nr:type II toxin-antitoxin system antitoxin SocA domain-containing protein [uncultured Sphingomonas sp.]
MSAWSEEIAAFLSREAGERSLPLDQLQLQALVYIAHGWHLATTGEPLTGDRPVITQFGPEYERLAKALRSYGVQKLEASALAPVNLSILDEEEVDLVSSIIDAYGDLTASQLATISRDDDSPWRKRVEAGLGQEIGHHEVRRQFEAYRKSEDVRAGAARA